jgi:hypothetical protein
LLIATVGSVEGLLHVIQHADPRGRPDGATEKGQCGIEQRPGYAFESLPAILRIGQRLPLCHFNQRIDVGLVQGGQVNAAEDPLAKGDRAAHLQGGQRVGQLLGMLQTEGRSPVNT